jgi:hypothetical protein
MRRPKPGDFIQIELPDGFAYLQFLGRHPGRFPMDMFAVLKSSVGRRLTAPELENTEPLYVSGSLVKAVLKAPNVTIVHGEKVSSRLDVPAIWRARRIGGWAKVVEGVEEETVQTLDEASAKLPIIELVPVTGLVERIASGWRPEDDRADVLLDLKQAVSKAQQRRREIEIYVEFDEITSARDAASALTKAGYVVEIAEDGTVTTKVTARETSANWISVVEEPIVQIAEAHGGRYSGNEIGL